MVVRRRLDPPQLQDGRLAHHADARERHRLHRRSRVPPPRSRRHVGSSDREAPEPRGRRNHGQRLRAGEAARGVGAVAAEGRRARGDAEQVRAVGRPAVTSAPADAGPQRVLFVTGKLAEPALRRTLTDMAPAFAHEVAVMKITVAALMTTPWIARFLDVPAGTDLVLIPGLCEGDVAVIAEKVGTRVEKGPKDLRQIPEYFGRAAATRAYGASDIEIVAEVNNAPRLAREALRREAEHYRASGADIIDVGCTPGREFPELAGVVRELVGGGMRVSIDSFDPSEIRTAVAAGAELVLSVNRSNLDVARDFARTKTRVVVIPDFGQGIETLEPSVGAVLTTEVIPWARGVVREVDLARRLMYHAVTQKTLPKGVDDRLVTLKDPTILAYGEAELRELQARVTDPNFRIFADREVITVFNHEIFLRGTDIHEIFAGLGVDQASHAFYLGRELLKAKLALTLGKNYRQEGG